MYFLPAEICCKYFLATLFMTLIKKNNKKKQLTIIFLQYDSLYDRHKDFQSL